MRLEMIKFKERAEEPARRQAEAPEEMRAEDDALTFLRRRKISFAGGMRVRM